MKKDVVLQRDYVSEPPAIVVVQGGGGGTAPSTISNHDHSGDAGDGGKHDILSAHTSAATSGQMLKADANGLPVNATNTDAAVAAAVTASHARQHNMLTAADHVYTGGANLDVFGLSAANTLAKLTPSSNPGAAAAILSSDPTTGKLTLTLLTISDLEGFTIGEIPNTHRVKTYAAAPTTRFLNAANQYSSVGVGALSIGTTSGGTAAPANGALIEGTVDIGGALGEVLDVAGDIGYSGALNSYKNTTNYTGYVFVPLPTPAVATDWDGDAKADASDGVINLQAAAPAGFALPAGIKAIAFSLYVKAATVGLSGALATSGTVYGVQVYAVVANQWNCGGGVVACDANGDVYWGAQGDLTGVILNILGYWI